ncbi:MAG: hypothetical protein Q9185_000061 [Variospora sp. 1 TL-2023]
MPRTLPWLKDQKPASKVKTSAAPPPPKRARPASPDLDSSDNNERSAARARARQRRREAAQRAGRTPSTSPPPPPIEEEEEFECMRASDETYMMVEDEFLSTAHLFTSHLHHAEYVRLKTLAARISSSSSENPPPLSRPTDSITAMRAETLRKKQADAKALRNRAAVEQMKLDARGGGIDISSSSDKDEDDEAEDEEADHHLWAGTSLQSLMVGPEQKKNLTSLRGIQGIQSSTRAAKGYYERKTDEGSPRRWAAKNQIIKSGGQPTKHQHHPKKRPSTSFSSPSSSDLDAPLSRRLRTSTSTSTKTHHPSKKPSNPHNHPLTLAAEDLFAKPIVKSKKTNPPPPSRPAPTNPPSKFDDDPTTVRRRVQARRERAAALEEKRRREEGVGNANVNEIPVFLV